MTQATYTITRRNQTDSDKLIYTKKSAACILKIDVENIEFVYVSDSFVLVGLFNSSVKLSKTEFKVMFVEDRKARSSTINVTQDLNKTLTYTVRNEDNNHRYQVRLKPDSIYCQCPDYQNQLRAGLNGCCKHGYSVLNVIGYGSLADYLKFTKSVNIENVPNTDKDTQEDLIKQVMGWVE